MSRVLVTGGAGFIGSHSVRYLLSQGMQVRVLDNLSSGKKSNLDLENPNLEFVEGDILELPLLKDLLQDCSSVLHLAAIASVPLSIQDPIYSFQVNTQGALHVLEAVRLVNNDVRVVYASSAAVYGDSLELPSCDESPLQAEQLSPYAMQKRHDEDYAALYARLHGVNSMGLRYFNVYGEGQCPNSPYSGVISRFLAAYAADQELTIYGDGLQSRDFVSVTDVARANYLALQSHEQSTVNIATGQAESLLDLIQYIEEAGQRPSKKNFLSARAGDIAHSLAATEKATRLLSFRAEVVLKDGIAAML